LKKNPFKEIATHKETPPELKKKVLGEIASIGLLSDMVDLFSIKFAAVIESALKPSKEAVTKKK